jgi:hypothetical protein
MYGTNGVPLLVQVNLFSGKYIPSQRLNYDPKTQMVIPWDFKKFLPELKAAYEQLWKDGSSPSKEWFPDQPPTGDKGPTWTSATAPSYYRYTGTIESGLFNTIPLSNRSPDSSSLYPQTIFSQY